MNRYSLLGREIYTASHFVKSFYGRIYKTEEWKKIFKGEKIIPFPRALWEVQREACLWGLESATNLPTALFRHRW